MTVTHVFKSETGKLYRPVTKVTSYGLLDLILHHDIFKSMSDKCDTLRVHLDEKKVREHVLWGVVLTEEVKRVGTVYSENLDVLDAVLDCNYQQKERAKHYRENLDQLCQWVSPKVQDKELLQLEYAVLCDPHDGRKKKGVVIHETCSDAVSALNEAGEKLKEDGYHQRYFPIFGGNSDFMRRYVNLEDKLPQKILWKMEDASEKFSELRRNSMIECIKGRVLALPEVQRHGMVDLIDDDGELVATVPKLPLICWGAKYLYLENKPNYKAISPSGLRISYDDPFHSDWVIAGGLGLNEDRKLYRKGNELALEWVRNWQSDSFDMEHHVLSASPNVEGRLFFATEDNAGDVQVGDIVVVPRGSVEFQLHMDKACKDGRGAIITEAGSAAVHLAKVCRERRVAILRIPDAKRILIEGLRVRVDSKRGKIDYI